LYAANNLLTLQDFNDDDDRAKNKPSSARCDLESARHDGRYYCGKPWDVDPNASQIYAQGRLARISHKIDHVITQFEAESSNELVPVHRELHWDLTRALEYRDNSSIFDATNAAMRKCVTCWKEIALFHELITRCALELEFHGARRCNTVIHECASLACRYADHRHGFVVRGVTLKSSNLHEDRKILQRHALGAGLAYLIAKKFGYPRRLDDVCRVFQPEFNSLKIKNVARAIAEVKLEFPQYNWNPIAVRECDDDMVRQPASTVSSSDTEESTGNLPSSDNLSSSLKTVGLDQTFRIREALSEMEYTVLKRFNLSKFCSFAVIAVVDYYSKSVNRDLVFKPKQWNNFCCAAVYFVTKAGGSVQALALQQHEQISNNNYHSMEDVACCECSSFWSDPSCPSWNNLNIDEIVQLGIASKTGIAEIYNRTMIPLKEKLLSAAHASITKGCRCGQCKNPARHVFSIRVGGNLLRRVKVVTSNSKKKSRIG